MPRDLVDCSRVLELPAAVAPKIPAARAHARMCGTPIIESDPKTALQTIGVRKSSATGHDSQPGLQHPLYVQQAGAICYRRTSREQPAEILLVASLRTGRWGIPKGHMEPGETTSQTAQREAFEEAGVWGTPEDNVFGLYIYEKEGHPIRFQVSVHLLEVTASLDTFPERQIRKTRWIPASAAINETGYPGLERILERFVFLATDHDLTLRR